MVIGAERRLGRSGFWSWGTLWRDGLNTLFHRFLQRFHAFTTGFQRQRDQFVKAWVVITGHECFHQHGNVNPGDNLIVWFVYCDAAGRVERAAAPGINQKQDAIAGIELTDFPIVFLN
ncbi:hypothetical protein D3C79_881210 [compost metagenome]